MVDKQEMISLILQLKKSLKQGSFSEKQYKEVCRQEDDYRKMGINPYDLKELLELKAKLTFCPDPHSYSVGVQKRVDYIYENLDNPDISLSGQAERGFLDAVRSYFSTEDEYKQKLQTVFRRADNAFHELTKSAYEQRISVQEVGLLTDMFLLQDIIPDPADYYSPIEALFHEYSLSDAYYMNDDGVTLQWKAGLLLESKGQFSPGTTEKILTQTGTSPEKLEAGLRQFRIDKLRVSDVQVVDSLNGNGKSLLCKVDGTEMQARKLSFIDVPRRTDLVDYAGLAVKYYRDVLNSNREQGLMIADERTLARLEMPDVDRLVDIYRNGANEQELMLAKASEKVEVDPFWWGYYGSGMAASQVENQKDAAFYILVGYTDELRPGMLTDAELFELCRTTMPRSSPGREVEQNLMELPECFFPLVEQAGEFDRDMIAYVKIMRDMGRTTPQTALQSMEYYLSMRSRLAWDPEGGENDYGMPIGASYYPNINMKNPAEKFAPNLINEKEWSRLNKQYSKVGPPFVPLGAFRKDRITEVQIYPTRDGSMMIRCMIDGMQQSARRLSEEINEVPGKNADREALAVRYFDDAFVERQGMGIRY